MYGKRRRGGRLGEVDKKLTRRRLIVRVSLLLDEEER